MAKRNRSPDPVPAEVLVGAPEDATKMSSAGHDCRIGWCRSARFARSSRQTGPIEHIGDGGTFGCGTAVISIMLVQEEVAGELALPVVRVFHERSGDCRHLDVTPAETEALAAIVQDVSRDRVKDLAAALVCAGRILGAG